MCQPNDFLPDKDHRLESVLQATLLPETPSPSIAQLNFLFIIIISHHVGIAWCRQFLVSFSDKIV